MASLVRTRWAAIGAAVAVTLGAGGIGLVSAGPLSSGERTVLVPINCRLADTRPAPDTVGPRTSPLGAGDTYTVAAHGTNGNCTIPADATALALNVTALGATAPLTFLTLWNADQPQPTTSSLNPAAGQPPTPNAVDVDLSATGQFKIFNALGSVGVIIDVTGYYQDHHHDDRYYTKADVDGLLDLDGPLAWGMAREDGSLRVESPNVVEVLHPGTGLYCVVFDPPIVNGNLEAATISGSGSGPIMAEKTNGIGGPDSCSGAPNGQGLELRIYNENGTLSDERFGFIVP